MPTTLSSLTPEILDAVLSEFVFSPTDVDQREKVIEHFAVLLERSHLLREAVEQWSAVASQENRMTDFFTLAVWLGWQCRYSIEEGRRLARLL